MGPIQTISYFARRVIQLEQKFARRSPKELQETAALFRSTGDGLDSLLECMDAGETLESACIALQTLLPKLELELRAEITGPESEKLAQMLRDAINPEKVQTQILQASNRNSLLDELDKAAILVRALADGLHAGQPAPSQS